MTLSRRLNVTVRRAKKLAKNLQRSSLSKAWSPVAFVLLFTYTLTTFTGAISADAAPSSQDLWGFSLSGSMTVNGMNEAGAGSFSNGNAGPYLERSCMPVVVELSNGGNSATNLVVPVAYDYAANGQAIDNLESVSTSLSGDPMTATNLNQFTFNGSSFSATTSAWTSAGSLTASVAGPFGGKNGSSAISSGDTSRHYTLTVQNVPSDATAKVVFCARLGADVGAASGSSVSVHFGSGGGQNIPINGTDIVELPSLTITKVVSGGTAVPSDFSFVVTPGIDGSASTNVSIPASQSSVTLSNILVNATQVFTVTEASGGPAGYAFSSGSGTNCTFSGSTASASVTAAAIPTNASCSFTNTKLVTPQLTIIKSVVNDNGGTLGASDFTMHVTGTNVSSAQFPGSASGTVITLDPGAYSVTEDGIGSYAGTLSADCSGTIAFGESKTCTVTNDDIPGTLTVVKVVDNTAGGTFAPSDFLMTVHGDISNSPNPDVSFPGSTGQNVSLDAGAYSVTESAGVNYSGSMSADCSGTIAVGEAKTCTVTNTYVVPSPTQGTIIVQKHVVNDSGFGTKSAADFTLDVHDTHGAVTSVAGSESGVTVMVDPGQYAVTEAADPMYAQTFGSACGGSIAAGETVTCLVTNDDLPALAPAKDILPSLQCVASHENGSYTAYFAYNNTNSSTSYLPIGVDNAVTGGGLVGNSHGQPEIFAAGASGAYPSSAFSVDFDGTTVRWLLRVAGDSTTALASSDSTPCPTVTPAVLTVFTNVINDSGAPALSVSTTSSTVTNGGPAQVFFNSETGVPVTLTPGSYSVASSSAPGYTVTYSPDCTGDIVQGESKVCTITYDDIQGETEDGFITVRKVISNFTTDEILVTDFVLNVRSSRRVRISLGGTDVDSGVETAFAPGSYQISETPADSERFSSEDYAAVFSGDCSSAGVIDLAEGQHATCTITNTFGTAPTGGNGGGGNGGGGGGGNGGSPTTTGLTIFTNVINDNGGSLLPSAFEVHVNGEDPRFTSGFSIAAVSTLTFAGSAGGVNVAMSPGAYTVTPASVNGYTFTMSAGCSGTLGSGQVQTCTITADDVLALATPAPTPIVLGDTDTAVIEPIAFTPVPQVLGATDEELPRTGFPVALLTLWVAGAAYVASKAERKH
jgi:hypothetical protein